jgi:hypothetical protein
MLKCQSTPMRAANCDLNRDTVTVSVGIVVGGTPLAGYDLQRLPIAQLFRGPALQ